MDVVNQAFDAIRWPLAGKSAAGAGLVRAAVVVRPLLGELVRTLQRRVLRLLDLVVIFALGLLVDLRRERCGLSASLLQKDEGTARRSLS